MTDEEIRLCESLAEVARTAEREAEAGAPGGMVAVYVRLHVMHSLAAHEGHWARCQPCHMALAAVPAP